MKANTHPKLFQCTKVIGRILPRANPDTMIISKTKGQPFVSFTPTYITKAYKLPTPQDMMTND